MSQNISGRLVCTQENRRLIANIRDPNGASGSGTMTRHWDFDIKEKDAEFCDNRAASGIGRRWRKVCYATRTVSVILMRFYSR